MLISIIIPVFNARPYLKCCLNSIVSKNMNNYEIVLIDDGSTDGSEKIAHDYVHSYKNIKLIRQKNQGAFSARNTGIISAKGDYILFLDADDYLLEGSVNYLLDIVMQKEYDIIFFGLRLFGSNYKLKTKPYLPRVTKYSNILYRMFLDSNSLAGYMGGKLIRKDIARQALTLFNFLNKRLELYEDCFFLFCASIYCKTGLVVTKKLYLYRIHHHSITQKTIRPDVKLKQLETARSCFEELKKEPAVQNHPYGLQALDRIKAVILSSELIVEANNTNYIKNIYKAWQLDSRVTNLMRIMLYIISFGKIRR